MTSVALVYLIITTLLVNADWGEGDFSTDSYAKRTVWKPRHERLPKLLEIFNSLPEPTNKLCHAGQLEFSEGQIVTMRDLLWHLEQHFDDDVQRRKGSSHAFTGVGNPGTSSYRSPGKSTYGKRDDKDGDSKDTYKSQNNKTTDPEPVNTQNEAYRRRKLVLSNMAANLWWNLKAFSNPNEAVRGASVLGVDPSYFTDSVREFKKRMQRYLGEGVKAIQNQGVDSTVEPLFEGWKDNLIERVGLISILTGQPVESILESSYFASDEVKFEREISIVAKAAAKWKDDRKKENMRRKATAGQNTNLYREAKISPNDLLARHDGVHISEVPPQSALGGLVSRNHNEFIAGWMLKQGGMLESFDCFVQIWLKDKRHELQSPVVLFYDLLDPFLAERLSDAQTFMFTNADLAAILRNKFLEILLDDPDFVDRVAKTILERTGTFVNKLNPNREDYVRVVASQKTFEEVRDDFDRINSRKFDVPAGAEPNVDVILIGEMETATFAIPHIPGTDIQPELQVLANEALESRRDDIRWAQDVLLKLLIANGGSVESIQRLLDIILRDVTLMGDVVDWENKITVEEPDVASGLVSLSGINNFYTDVDQLFPYVSRREYLRRGLYMGIKRQLKHPLKFYEKTGDQIIEEYGLEKSKEIRHSAEAFHDRLNYLKLKEGINAHTTMGSMYPFILLVEVLSYLKTHFMTWCSAFGEMMLTVKQYQDFLKSNGDIWAPIYEAQQNIRNVQENVWEVAVYSEIMSQRMRHRSNWLGEQLEERGQEMTDEDREEYRLSIKNSGEFNPFINMVARTVNIHFEDMFTSQMAGSEFFTLEMSSEHTEKYRKGDLTKRERMENYGAVVRQIKTIFSDTLHLEWAPKGGTMMAFLRYGANSAWEEDHKDFENDDIDLFIGADDEMHSQHIMLEITERLKRSTMGEFYCFGKSIHPAANFQFRNDLLFCMRRKPALMLLDIGSFLRKVSIGSSLMLQPGEKRLKNPIAVAHRLCENNSHFTPQAQKCVVRNDIVMNGVNLTLPEIYPSERCLAFGVELPCPIPEKALKAIMIGGPMRKDALCPYIPADARVQTFEDKDWHLLLDYMEKHVARTPPVLNIKPYIWDDRQCRRIVKKYASDEVIARIKELVGDTTDEYTDDRPPGSWEEDAWHWDENGYRIYENGEYVERKGGRFITRHPNGTVEARGDTHFGSFVVQPGGRFDGLEEEGASPRIGMQVDHARNTIDRKSPPQANSDHEAASSDDELEFLNDEL